MKTYCHSDTDSVPDTHGALAQLVAQPVVSRKVAGSNPVRPVIHIHTPAAM